MDSNKTVFSNSIESLENNKEHKSTTDLVNDEENAPIVDPWALIDPPANGTPWKDQNLKERILTSTIVIIKLITLLGLIYLFICSLDFLSNAFQLLGGQAASKAFTQSEILSNPISNLVIGILATVLVQSSSTTTSIIVSMVAVGIIPIKPAIFMVMGANIGTSVTNTIVSLGHWHNKNEFRRAFGGATIHDMFNWLSVLILLPIEWLSSSVGPWKDHVAGMSSLSDMNNTANTAQYVKGCGLLCQITSKMVGNLKSHKTAKKELLKTITKPFTNLFVVLDKKVLNMVAEGKLEAGNKSIIKHTKNGKVLKFIFEKVSRQPGGWSDTIVGVCMLIIALTLLCLGLYLIVKLLHSMLKGAMARAIKTSLNSNFPGKFSFLTGYFAILIGSGMTILLQSSSIFTSALTPLVGVGVLKLERMLPLTLGANIGTTFTAILAALANEGDKLNVTMQIALCHLFFNVFGILVWYPIPAMRRIPIKLARNLGNKTSNYRWFAIVYLIFMFFILPSVVFGLSLAGWRVLLGVCLPFFLLFCSVVLVNVLQARECSRKRLPEKLRSWEFLPRPFKSLEFYDFYFFQPLFKGFKKCMVCRKKTNFIV